MQNLNRYFLAKKVTLIGAVTNFLLGLMKLMGGILFHSHALVADGLHSFADLVTDAMVLFASKYGSQAADDMHPYGHQRIETTATLLLAIILIITGIGMAWDSIYEIIHATNKIPKILAAPVALISVIINEGLFHWTRQIGNRIHSPLIIANAWHHRSDASASLIVLLGLLGSIIGIHIMDPIAAVIIAVLIVKMGLGYCWSSIRELIDTSVQTDTLTSLVNNITKTPGVRKIHQLRTRSLGNDIYVDVHIQVDPFISVSEGHYIAQKVHYGLSSHNPHVKDVTVHVDPEDDETAAPSQHLTERLQLEKTLLNPWKNTFNHLESWQIHYIEGTIHLDLIFSGGSTASEHLQQRISEDLAKTPIQVSRIRCLFHQTTIEIVCNLSSRIK